MQPMSRAGPTLAVLLLLARCLAPTPASAADAPPADGPRPLAKLAGPSGTDVAFSRDGKLLLTAGGDEAREPDVQTYEEVALPGDRSEAPFTQVGQVAGGVLRESTPFDAGGNVFFTLVREGARVWDTATLKPIAGPLPHDHIWYARLVAGGKTLLTVGPKDVKVWDVATSKLLSATQVAHETTQSFDASPNGSQFTTIDRADERTAAVWRTGQREPALRLRHSQTVWTAEFDPSGKRIVTHESGAFHVWSAQTGRELYPPIRSNDTGITPGRARFSPQGDRLLVAQEQGFTVVNAATGEKQVEVRFDDLFFTGRLRFSCDGKRVAVAMLDWHSSDTIRLFDPATGTLVREFGKDMCDCQIELEGRWAWCRIAVRNQTNVQEVWDLTTGTKVQTIDMLGEAPAMSPDGSTVLIGDRQFTNRTVVWRLRPGRPANPS
jgi:WD40 repeat protein